MSIIKSLILKRLIQSGGEDVIGHLACTDGVPSFTYEHSYVKKYPYGSVCGKLNYEDRVYNTEAGKDPDLTFRNIRQIHPVFRMFLSSPTDRTDVTFIDGACSILVTPEEEKRGYHIKCCNRNPKYPFFVSPHDGQRIIPVAPHFDGGYIEEIMKIYTIPFFMDVGYLE